MVRAIASPLVALLALVSPPLVAGAAAASSSPVLAGGTVPADRGIDPDDRDGDGRPDKETEAEPVPCPTDLWNIPIEIEGLACILLLPKETPDDDDAEQDERGQRGRR